MTDLAHGTSKALEWLSQIGDRVPSLSELGEISAHLLRVLEAERVFVFRFRKGGGFRVTVARDFDGDRIGSPDEKMSHYAVTQMVRRSDLFVVPDARKDRRFRSEDAAKGGRPAQSILIVPIWLDGELSGGVYADHRFRSFDEGSVDTEAVALWLGVCRVAVHLRERRSLQRLAERRSASRQKTRESEVQETVRPTGIPLERAALAESLTGDDAYQDFHGFVSANPDLKDVFDDIRRLSTSDVPVLLRGETGVGKSLLAKAIHASSSRSSGPFVTLSCGALPDSLLESELVGHRRGAFTGAETDRRGVFLEAHGGTLCLEEVADMSASVQTKLLRILEDGRVRPLGGSVSDVEVADVRLVTCTSEDLEERVRDGRFRSDLYYRLKSVVFEIPSLRERWEDVPGLARRFLSRYHRDSSVVTWTDEAVERLLSHPWPGNARELENEMRRIAALGHPNVTPDLLCVRSSAETLSDSSGVELETVISNAEREAILRALENCGGNKSKAATQLGITRKALYRRLSKYGI
ncbi:MAG: sigma-54-dependent Fis family transcriptional regulator [Planctomycetota bacterium]